VIGCYRVAGKFKESPSLKRRVSGGREPEQGKFPMLLRDHPLMRYHGIPNWPPSWLFIDGVENKHPRGEIGTLMSVEVSNVPPSNRCFLCIDYAGSSYLGCLLFDNHAFCDQIVTLLRANLNRAVAEIGSLDLSYTL
jgi:hypothetical protein